MFINFKARLLSTTNTKKTTLVLRGVQYSFLKTADKGLSDKMVSDYAVGGAITVLGLGSLATYLTYKRQKFMFLHDRVYKSFLKNEGVKLGDGGKPLKYGDIELQKKQLVGRGKALAKFKDWEPTKTEKFADFFFIAKVNLVKGNLYGIERKRLADDVRNYHYLKKMLQASEQSIPETV